MSFFRPEAKRLILRWLETAIFSAVAVGGVALLLMRGPYDPVWRYGLAAFWAIGGFWIVRSAVLSALTARAADAPGVVQVDERRIAYFGPHRGGVVSIDDVFAIELHIESEADWQAETEWVLRWSEDEPALVIPVSAEGAGGLLDAFSALPGFSAERAIAALRGPEGARLTIWRRAAASSGPALAPARSEG